MKWPAGFVAVTQCAVRDERHRHRDEKNDDRKLDRDDDIIHPRRFLNADDQERA